MVKLLHTCLHTYWIYIYGINITENPCVPIFGQQILKVDTNWNIQKTFTCIVDEGVKPLLFAETKGQMVRHKIVRFVNGFLVGDVQFEWIQLSRFVFTFLLQQFDCLKQLKIEMRIIYFPRFCPWFKLFESLHISVFCLKLYFREKQLFGVFRVFWGEINEF